jgi:Ca2+-binding EF-hand superfamily protein/uncharacterized membrane protein YgcG
MDADLAAVMAESMGDGMGGLGMSMTIPGSESWGNNGGGDDEDEMMKKLLAESKAEAGFGSKEDYERILAETAEGGGGGEKAAEEPEEEIEVPTYKLSVFVVADPSRSLPEECEMVFDSDGISIFDNEEALFTNWNWSWILQVVYHNPAADAENAGVTVDGDDLEELMDEFHLYVDEEFDEEKRTQKYIFEVEDGQDALKWCKLYMPIHDDLEKGLRPSQMSYLKAIYCCLDLTGEGVVSGEEINLVVKADANSNPLLEYDQVEENTTELFKLIGLPSNKSLSFEDFITYIEYTEIKLKRTFEGKTKTKKKCYYFIAGVPLGVMKLYKAFANLDWDANGTVSFEDMKEVLKFAEVKMPDKMLKRVFKQVDTNGSGDINWFQWIELHADATKAKRMNALCNNSLDPAFLSALCNPDMVRSKLLITKQLGAKLKEVVEKRKQLGRKARKKTLEEMRENGNKPQLKGKARLAQLKKKKADQDQNAADQEASKAKQSKLKERSAAASKKQQDAKDRQARLKAKREEMEAEVKAEQERAKGRNKEEPDSDSEDDDRNYGNKAAPAPAPSGGGGGGSYGGGSGRGGGSGGGGGGGNDDDMASMMAESKSDADAEMEKIMAESMKDSGGMSLEDQMLQKMLAESMSDAAAAGGY